MRLMLNLPVPFSPKQRKAIGWWHAPATKHFDAVICDGAVRSGKTTAISLGFVFWAMTNFDQQAFALCGKTKVSLRRNLLLPLIALLRDVGFRAAEKLSLGCIEISTGDKCNRFYCFGGKDEGSAALIQGMTLAGVLSGSYTDPPALAYATNSTNNDEPAVAYSTVYPLTMFLRVVVAQLIVLYLL